MSASVSTLPVWKKDSSATEWLQELAAMTLEYPERWKKIVIIFEETNEKGQSIKTRHLSKNVDTNCEILGILETTKMELFDYMKGRH